MRTDRTTTALLAVIAVFLGMLALGPVFERPAFAQSGVRYGYLFVEPSGAWESAGGNPGLVVIDMRTGARWGVPFESSTSGPHGLTVGERAQYLGRYRFEDIIEDRAVR